MAFTTLAGVTAAVGSAQKLTFMKTVANAGISTGTPVFVSAWTVAGLPGQGVAPSSGLAGDVPTDATTGSFPFTNPTSGDLYLARMHVRDSFAGHSYQYLTVYDRLWHNSGIGVTTLTAQTVNSVALTRPNSNGDTAELWWEVYATMGSGTPTWTASYTNSAGTSGRTATSSVMATTNPVGRTGPFNLDSGDTGVRSVQSVTISATHTSGTQGLVIRRPVTSIRQFSYKTLRVDPLTLGLPRISNDACLELIWHTLSNQTFFLAADLFLANG